MTVSEDVETSRCSPTAAAMCSFIVVVEEEVGEEVDLPVMMMILKIKIKIIEKERWNMTMSVVDHQDSGTRFSKCYNDHSTTIFSYII